MGSIRIWFNVKAGCKEGLQDARASQVEGRRANGKMLEETSRVS